MVMMKFLALKDNVGVVNTPCPCLEAGPRDAAGHKPLLMRADPDWDPLCPARADPQLAGRMKATLLQGMSRWLRE